jgi:cytochrome c
MSRQRWILLFAAASAFVCESAAAAGDAGRGAQVFQQCTACHSVEPQEHMTGPSLAHVWNRKAGAAPGFQRYSEALKRSGVQWNEATLDQWLANPARFVPGNAMMFPGLRAAQDRKDVIAYLRAVDAGKAPPLAQRGRGMGMSMQPRRLDLSQAPPEGQVTSIRYCGDTYTIDTADGKSQKIWEFNLRLKTDSSKLGPKPGKPVAVGAGMQGDRASVIFASPGEISETIRPSCP